MIVLMAGLPGTGKTTLADVLARRTSGRVLGKDEIRRALFLPDEIEYSSQQDDFCLQIILETAGYLLRRDSKLIVFLDGRPFSRSYQIDNIVNAAASLHQSWRIVECICPEEIARARLREQDEKHPAANRDFQLYAEVRDRFETIALPKIVIDTSQPIETCLKLALATLRSQPAKEAE